MAAVNVLPISLQLLVYAWTLTCAVSLFGSVALIWAGLARGRHRRRMTVREETTRVLGFLRGVCTDLATGFVNGLFALKAMLT